VGETRDAYYLVSPAEKDHMRMGVLEKDMLLILYVISIAQVTSREGTTFPVVL